MDNLDYTRDESSGLKPALPGCGVGGGIGLERKDRH
jgi:hypothetical protein